MQYRSAYGLMVTSSETRVSKRRLMNDDRVKYQIGDDFSFRHGGSMCLWLACGSLEWE